MSDENSNYWNGCCEKSALREWKREQKLCFAIQITVFVDKATMFITNNSILEGIYEALI